MGLGRNLRLAKLAVEYTTKYVVKDGANNKFSDLVSSAGKNLWRVTEMRKIIDKFPGGFGSTLASDPHKTQRLPFYRWRAKAAKAAGVGNCGEQAAVALMFLHEFHRVKPLDYMSYNKPGDHAWVLIGRKKGSKTADYKSWGDDAVVCDPWGGVAFPAIEVPQKLPAYSKYSQHGMASRLVIE